MTVQSDTMIGGSSCLKFVADLRNDHARFDSLLARDDDGSKFRVRSVRAPACPAVQVRSSNPTRKELPLDGTVVRFPCVTSPARFLIQMRTSRTKTHARYGASRRDLNVIMIPGSYRRRLDPKYSSARQLIVANGSRNA